MSYQIIDNKIYTQKACEINIVAHCNLSCRSCSHLSPTFSKYFEAPDNIFDNCSILAKYYRPKYIKLLGGEPLLHPNLIQVLEAVRNSGISNYIQVMTNGLLLAKMSDEFWQKVDEVYVSVYPEKGIDSEDLKIYEQKAKLHNVSFQCFYFDNFRESYSEIGTTDKNLVQQIYSTCKLAHTWRCHTVANGYFYKCPRSLFIPKAINNDILQPNKDGIKIIDSPEFTKDLLAYLESTEPLTSCYHCLGNVGKLFVHEQQSRNTWRMQQQYPTEELVDMQYLACLEKNLQANTSCIRYRSPMKKALAQVKRVHRNLAKQLSR